MRKLSLILVLAVLVAMVFSVSARAATIKEIMPADVRAATSYGVDVDAADYQGTATFILSAELQGSGITETMVLQDSGSPAVGDLNETTTGDSWISLRDASGSDTEIAAQFVQSAAKQIKHVWLYLKRLGTIATGSVYIKIEGDNASNLPSGTALTTSAAVAASNVTTTGGWVQFSFAMPYDLTASETYHAVLYGDYTASPTAHVKAYAISSPTTANAEICTGGVWAEGTSLSFMAFDMEYDFDDITGGTFTAVGNTAASFQTKSINMDGVKRYIRGKNTVAGGSATGATCVIMTGKKQYEP